MIATRLSRGAGQRTPHCGFAVAALAAFVCLFASAAHATKIERVVSPGGIEAWLVHETTLPLIAVEVAFRGGANQDPADMPGVANMAADLLDEGAGDLDAKAFHERLEERAISFGFAASREHLHGSVRTLVENRDEAFALLKLALTAPRFDADPVERIRTQILAQLRREAVNPTAIANRRWWSVAFPGHAYGQPGRGTIEAVSLIGVEDLKTFMRRSVAKDGLKIAVVGDIDAATLGPLLDQTFGSLPDKAELTPIPDMTVQGLGREITVSLDVPQAVVAFGGVGIPRKDPDFFAAYIVNHILGGGTFSSRLYAEIREKRGLAYGVSSSLIWLDHASLFVGFTATRAEKAGETVALIQDEIRRMAETGPTAEELAKAKAFLKGSYGIAFDTSAKIAGQLLQIQIDGLGIDYIDRRNAMIDAVTLVDVQRVAKRLLGGGLLVTVVGRPQGLPVKSQGG
jgi:zinc protease